MSIDVKSLSVLINSIVELGAKICVLSDMSGLPMVTRSNLNMEDVETALSALSSIVVPTGDTIARELEGNFVNMTVRTTGGLLLSTVIDSDPKVVLTAIVDENLEPTYFVFQKGSEISYMNSVEKSERIDTFRNKLKQTIKAKARQLRVNTNQEMRIVYVRIY